MKAQLRLNTRLLPFLVFVLVVMQIIDPSRVWTIFLVGLGGLWLISYIWARNLALSLTILREMRYGWLQVGDVLEERFTVENKSWLPATWLELEDHSTVPGYNASIATGVDGSGMTRWRKTVHCNQRGQFQLGDTIIHTGDPFGIYSVSIKDSGSTSLMILPPIVPIPYLKITPGGYSAEGRPIPDAPARTVDASSIREYAPGDPVRWVHWKTTARFSKPYVRLFDGSPATDWWILLDLQADAQAGVGKDSTEEHSIILAASLADRGLRENHGVGLIVNGHTLESVPPLIGTGQRWKILHLLAMAAPGKPSLAAVLKHTRPDLGRHTSLIIVSSTPKTDWINTLPLLIRKGIRPTVFLLELRSFDKKLDNSKVAAELKKIHVPCHMISRELLDRPEALPGKGGQWEWRIMPTGRAIPVRAPDDHRWRRLSQ